MLRRVVWQKFTDVPEVLVASTIEAFARKKRVKPRKSSVGKIGLDFANTSQSAG
jgi:hypothetical protein